MESIKGRKILITGASRTLGTSFLPREIDIVCTTESISEYRDLRLGDVYFVKPKGHQVVKIGKCSHGKARKRISQLQTGCHETLELIGCVAGGGVKLEKELHKKLAVHHLRGEWFKLNKEVQSYIDRLCKGIIEMVMVSKYRRAT